ncbi:MAG: CoA pyrophosphatase [Betaproteobacteria bacterium]|nr:CoA pyrophosphatase [Betaproteobacteria bacterium]
MKSLSFGDALLESIAANLARLTPVPLEAHGLKRAAVCVVVTADDEGNAALVLTRRAEHLSAHAGQFALPGGRVEEGESALDAARREAREEIGLALPKDALLGRLDDYPTRSGYLITPFVAWCAADAPLQPNPSEVASIYRVPLSEFGPGPEFIEIPESDRPVVRYPLLGTRVHAPTAAVIYQFVEVGLHGRQTRVAHLEQPRWAWR